MSKSKKPWTIVVSTFVDPEMTKKIKKVLKPDLSVAGRPGKCIFCGEETTWTINKEYVCPRCTGRYGFANPDYLPEPCVVCGRQGEWVCGEEDQHSLCFKHRDAWYNFTKSELNMAPYTGALLSERGAAWDKCFEDFVKRSKEAEKEVKSETR